MIGSSGELTSLPHTRHIFLPTLAFPLSRIIPWQNKADGHSLSSKMNTSGIGCFDIIILSKHNSVLNKLAGVPLPPPTGARILGVMGICRMQAFLLLKSKLLTFIPLILCNILFSTVWPHVCVSRTMYMITSLRMLGGQVSFEYEQSIEDGTDSDWCEISSKKAFAKMTGLLSLLSQLAQSTVKIAC